MRQFVEKVGRWGNEVPNDYDTGVIILVCVAVLVGLVVLGVVAG